MATQDLVYPDWFEGLWEVESLDLLVNAERWTKACPSCSIWSSFGSISTTRWWGIDQLISVEQAPHQVNRQLARLSNDRLLETTVIGREQTSIHIASFVSDELVLQVMHGARAPRLSRIETLSRYQPCQDEPSADIVSRICGEQWQQTYPAPGAASESFVQRASRYKLTLTRLQDPA